MPSVIEIIDLKKSFGSFEAVKGVSFTVAEGEIFGLLGPNGAGKTTIIRILTTLLPLSSGQSRVCSYDVRRQATPVRQSIGYVPQALSAAGAMTGYENMLIFAKLFGLGKADREKQIKDLLLFMQLDQDAHKQVKFYSGGMVRRLEIAQAALHRPRVLFLDEPTVGLDPVARKAVWGKLLELRQAYGMTILLTTHYMEEADALCDRVGILNHGEMAATGQPGELKQQISQPNATLDDVFAFYTGNQLNEGGSFRDLKRIRRTSKRLG